MKWSLSSIFRTLTWMAVGLTVLAVALGRHAPRTIPTYQAAAVRYHGLNMHCSSAHEAQPGFLDRETGQILELRFAPEDFLDYAVCSPWRDEHGQFHAVARWMKRAGGRSDYLPQEFGLARFTLPEGRLIDRVKLDHVPVGDPCWVPGVTPRIVYSAGDGHLYAYSFEKSNPDPFGPGQEHARTQRLVWRTAPPGSGLLYIKDLIWPDTPKLGRRLFASMSYREEADGQARMTLPQLWWLQISDDATAIEASGRLTALDAKDDAGDEVVGEQRLPSIVATADGELALAYLSRTSHQSLWELRVATLTIDPATRVPAVSRGRSHGVAGGFLATAPSFSADGRWLYGIGNLDHIGSRLTARRFSVNEVLAQAGGAPLAPGLARAEPLFLDSGIGVRPAGVRTEPGRPRAESTSLLGWANLGIFDPNWLVKTGAGRHAGE